MIKQFAIIGTAGYIAPRHLKAIKDVGGNLIAALDTSDSVGILDQYFPDCEFFTNELLFQEFLVKQTLDFLVVCSPNYLHEQHCLLGLNLNANVICEKPLTLTVESLVKLQQEEARTKKQIFTILQLRLHPIILKLKQEIDFNKIQDVKIEYRTPRGKWYHNSWKGNISKSGGIATNIGIHLFDLVTWLFGETDSVFVEKNTPTECCGALNLDKAKVSWVLSIEQHSLPQRKITIGNKTIEFTEGFTDLHTISYQEILRGNGFTTQDVRASINIVEQIRML